MTTGQLPLENIIKTTIANEGPLCFRDFMEMALYYPDLGYYTSPGQKIGRSGDFYTSSYVSPVFGALIARQLEEMDRLLGEKEFTVVEYGAGTGLLCRDILACLKSNRELYDRLNYCIIEKSSTMRKIAAEHLGEKVNWCDCIQNMHGLKGCVLSNELVDNLSVHQVVMEDEMMEVFVDYNGEFIEVLKPARKELKDYFAELRIELPQGFRTEVNLEALAWIKEVAGALHRGYVVTIDYGYPSSELYDVRRSTGTLTCYHKHSTSHQPYKAIGEQDITAHVNFSALCLWGHKNGLDYCGYRDQGDFLLALGFKDQMKAYRQQQKNDLLKYEKEAFLSHLLIEDMGRKFKVLIQQKAVEKKQLSGLSCLF
jgi:SAM-dependent MidA family methyltransferase